MEPKQLLTTSQVASILNVHILTVQRYVREGEFPNTVRLGGRYYRIPMSDVEAFLKSPE